MDDIDSRTLLLALSVEKDAPDEIIWTGVPLEWLAADPGRGRMLAAKLRSLVEWVDASAPLAAESLKKRDGALADLERLVRSGAQH